jgi:molecular chaperone GrpE
VAELTARVAQLEDQLLRARADFQNLQRRAAHERSEAVRYGNADLMKALLNGLDDLERTLKAAESPKNHDSLIAGVKLVYANFLKALQGFGLEPISARGERFDPLIHEALMQRPSQEFKPGTVIEEVARGYRLRDRVLRPAKVVVASSPQAVSEPAPAGRTSDE